MSYPLCESTAFACLAADNCATDVDCVGVFVNVAFCGLQGGHRACSTERCTTP